MLKALPNNVLISPLSVKVLLTLLAEAAGQTVESKTRKVSCIVDTTGLLMHKNQYLCRLRAGVVLSVNTADTIHANHNIYLNYIDNVKT